MALLVLFLVVAFSSLVSSTPSKNHPILVPDAGLPILDDFSLFTANGTKWTDGALQVSFAYIYSNLVGCLTYFLHLILRIYSSRWGSTVTLRAFCRFFEWATVFCIAFSLFMVPSFTNIYFFTFTAIFLVAALANTCWNLYSVGRFAKRYSLYRNAAVAAAGSAVIVSGSTVIPVTNAPVAITLLEMKDGTYYYQGSSREAVNPRDLRLVTNRGVFTYTRKTTFCNNELSSTKYHLFGVSSKPDVNVDLTSVCSGDSTWD